MEFLICLPFRYVAECHRGSNLNKERLIEWFPIRGRLYIWFGLFDKSCEWWFKVMGIMK